MPRDCAVCGNDTGTACRYCDRPVCADHEDPGAHRCAGPRTAPATAPDTVGAGERDPVRLGAFALATTMILAVAIVVTVSAGPAGLAADDDIETARLAALVADLANEERTARGLEPLVWNETLADMAGAHSTDMASKGYFGHVGNSTVRQRYERAGLTCLGGENIYRTVAVGTTGSERTLARRTVRAWLDSQGHRATLLGERFRSQGVGVAVIRSGSRTTLYVTQNVC